MFCLVRASKISAVVALVLTSQVTLSSVGHTQQVPCGERDSILKQLNGTYDEKQVAAGVTADGQLLEVFAGTSGSWTVLITHPGGPTCVATSGDGWRQIKPASNDPVA